MLLQTRLRQWLTPCRKFRLYILLVHFWYRYFTKLKATVWNAPGNFYARANFVRYFFADLALLLPRKFSFSCDLFTRDIFKCISTSPFILSRSYSITELPLAAIHDLCKYFILDIWIGQNSM